MYSHNSIGLRSSIPLFLQIIYFIGILFIFQACTIEGDDPDYTDTRDKFLGTWNVSDQPGRINYVVSIVKNPAQSTQVTLNNFADMGGSAIGLVVGNRIIIDKQNIGDDFLSNGTGTYISTKQLDFEFVLDNGIDIETRKAIYSK